METTHLGQTSALPASPDDHDAYLITGSPAGVYEPLRWLAPLSGFIRAAERQKLVGTPLFIRCWPTRRLGMA